MKRFGFGLVLALALGAALPAGTAPTPPAVFRKHCTACHGNDGKARTPVARKLGVKDLSISRIPEEEITRQILEGRQGVDGSVKMPPFKDKLTPEEVKELVGVVKGFRN